MGNNNAKAIIEAILFAAGRPVEKKDLILSLEMSIEEINGIITIMQREYEEQNRGIQIIQVEDSYQLCTKKELYEYIYPVLDKRNKPKLSNAALETLAIIAYNPRITRAEIEAIRGVSADGCVYKLLEYELIQEAGKVDELPGKPMSYQTTQEFLKMFGYTSLKDLPELPKYRLDENRQIVIDELVEDKANEKDKEIEENNINKEESIQIEENNSNIEILEETKQIETEIE